MTWHDRAIRHDGSSEETSAHESTAEPVRRFSCVGARIELLPARPYETRYVADMDGIGFAFDLQRGVHAFGSDRVELFCTRPNSVAFVPRGCDVYSHSLSGGEYLVVSLGDTGESPLSCVARFTDIILPPVVASAHRLRARLLGSAVEPLLVEGEVHELLRGFTLQALPKPRQPAAAAWMTPHRFRTITDMIEARLDEPLTVDALAAELGLSAGFFTRAFKAATARSPHSYIVDRRIARARRMLLGLDQRGEARGLADIAAATGFSSQAHMTSAFRERLGVSPGRLARQVGAGS